jgi:hypothetical protein
VTQPKEIYLVTRMTTFDMPMQLQGNSANGSHCQSDLHQPAYNNEDSQYNRVEGGNRQEEGHQTKHDKTRKS